MAEFPFDIVAFDLDGTLLDTFRDLGAAVNHALQQGGFDAVSVESSKDLIGGGAKIMLARAVEAQGGMPEDEFRKLYKVMLRYYSENNAVFSEPYPYVVDVLKTLAAKGVKLAVVTNKFEEFARDILTQLKLIDHFEVVIGGNSLGKNEEGVFRAKPLPDPILEAQRVCSPDADKPASIAFVGDSTYDVAAAKAAQVPVVAVTYGYHDKDPHEMGAEAVIDSLDQLIPALEAL